MPVPKRYFAMWDTEYETWCVFDRNIQDNSGSNKGYVGIICQCFVRGDSFRIRDLLNNDEDAKIVQTNSKVELQWFSSPPAGRPYSEGYAADVYGVGRYRVSLEDRRQDRGWELRLNGVLVIPNLFKSKENAMQAAQLNVLSIKLATEEK